MFIETLDRKPVVAFFGGIGDTEKTMSMRAQPLRDLGYEIITHRINWFKRKPKIDEIIGEAQELLVTSKAEVAYGASGGGLELVDAGFGLPSLKRIITAAAPIRRPDDDEMTRKIRGIMAASPLLEELRDYYYKNIFERVQRGEPTHQQFLHFYGTRDTRVPPPLSIMAGSNEGMLHIRHEPLETPPLRERGTTMAHTHTINHVVYDRRFLEFVKGNLGPLW